MPVIPALRRLRKEDPQLEGSLGYIDYLNKFKNSKQK
jgi:hypothetical protein